MGVIRTILALSVVVWHSGGLFGWFPFNGASCVQLFFIISGFYMALILNEKYLEGAQWLFWQNRFLRLWPGFFCAVLLTVPLSPDLPLKIFRELSDPAAILLVVVSNVTMVAYEIESLLCPAAGGTLALCRSASQQSIMSMFYLPQGWSLGLELWFYLIAPFLVRHRVRLFAALLVATFCFEVSHYYAGWTEPWPSRFFPSIAVYFFLGSCSYHGGMMLKGNRFENVYRFVGVVVFLPLSITLLLFPAILASFLPLWHQNNVFFAIFSAFIPAWFAWSRDRTWDNRIGNLSYPIYVVHLAVIGWISADGQWLSVVAVGVSIVAAFIINVYIEGPIDRWRQERIRLANIRPRCRNTSRLL